MDWSDFRLEQTQQIDGDVTLDGREYKVQCADIQRAMRKDLFDAAQTALSADFLAADSTMDVFDTTDFEPCTHVASFGDQTTGSFYYLKIKYQNGFEIVRATGKTATTFTGVTRGMFGTNDIDHVYEAGTDGDDGITVEEYVYLELPAPAMAYALMTGDIIGGGTIPDRWSLGIDPTFVNQPSFEDIGEDWFDSSDYSKGLIFRFQGVPKSDGKRFIEREVMMLAGAFMLVGADGAVSMRRMTGVIGSADYVRELTAVNIVKHGPLKHNLNRVKNLYDVTWAPVDIPGEDAPRFVRRNILADATSIALHGETKPLSLKFWGLHNERHTYTTLINRFDSVRDRYAGPPLTMRVDLLPAENNLEVGDIVRCKLDQIEDYSGTGFLDRSFEIQRITVNQKTGKVSADLFGSSMKADPIADTGAGVNAELPDGWYNSAGTEMATAGLTISAGVMTANGSLTGGTTTRTIFYFLGDFTIQSGVTLTLSGNVELRIRGHLQVNGDIVCGSGMAANTAGFIGTTYGGPGLFKSGSGPFPPNGATTVFGTNSAMPVLEIENNSGVLAGVPADMRGSGGGRGGSVWYKEDIPWLVGALGGVGGVGGGSLVTVSRGVAYGVSGLTSVNGTNGNTGGVYLGDGAGSGGGGAPGCLLHLLDGSGVTFPVMFGKIEALYGTSPITNSEDRTQGKALASDPVDLGVSNARVQYVPKSRDPYPDYTNLDLAAQDGADGISTYAATIYQRAATAPATPAADDGSYNFGTGVLTPAVGWSTTPPTSDGNPLWVSTGLFSVQGTTGTDNTVTWTAPAELVSDGADGADGTDGTNGTDGGDGNSIFYASIFIRSASAPATPTGGSYNFGTKTLTPPATWSATPPAADGNPLYTSTAIAEVNGTTGIDSTLTWTAPAELVSDGVDGTNGSDGSDGTSIVIASVFIRSASVPATPTANDGQYNFTSSTLTPPTGWSTSPPAADGNSMYVSQGTLSLIHISEPTRQDTRSRMTSSA